MDESGKRIHPLRALYNQLPPQKAGYIKSREDGFAIDSVCCLAVHPVERVWVWVSCATVPPQKPCARIPIPIHYSIYRWYCISVAFRGTTPKTAPPGDRYSNTIDYIEFYLDDDSCIPRAAPLTPTGTTPKTGWGSRAAHGRR